jgi:hypothetical protein
VFDVTEKQAAIIRQKIEQLQAMRDDLETKLVTYRGWLDHLEAHAAEQSAAPR